MKRTWVVYVQQGVGHEMNNCISEAEFYGPYTREEAERIEKELNAVFLESEPDNDERPEASTMCLENVSPRELVKRIKSEAVSTAEGDGEED